MGQVVKQRNPGNRCIHDRKGESMPPCGQPGRQPPGVAGEAISGRFLNGFLACMAVDGIGDGH